MWAGTAERLQSNERRQAMIPVMTYLLSVYAGIDREDRSYIERVSIGI